MAQVKLENCTKEELIAFIRHECFLQRDKIGAFIRFYRYRKLCEEARQLRQKSIDRGKKLSDLLKRYEGMNFSDIPLSEMKKIGELKDKSRDLWRRSKIVQNRAECLLEREEDCYE